MQHTDGVRSVPVRDPRARGDQQRLRRAIGAVAVALVVSLAVAAPMATRVATGETSPASAPLPTPTAAPSTTRPSPPTVPPSSVPVQVLAAVAFHEEMRVCSGSAPQPM